MYHNDAQVLHELFWPHLNTGNLKLQTDNVFVANTSQRKGDFTN